MQKLLISLRFFHFYAPNCLYSYGYLSLWICNPQGEKCGSATRADWKSANYDSGIANPRGHVSEDKTPREVAVDAFLHQIVTNDR